MNRIGIVIIGRNEGERLRRCLAAVGSAGASLVYVDSGSTDASVELAQQLGASVVALDMSTPFTAARARNAGFDRLLELVPDVDHVQFVDGDCELREGWLDAAIQSLDAEEQLAAVCGRVRERFPERSIYNRLCDLEWNGPAGEITATGGIAMMRASAFRTVGGFDPTVPAGEEPELCARLRQAGWKIRRLDADMTWHDSAMLRFSQWWIRQIRTGYGGLNVAHRFGRDDPALFRQTIRSARLWTIGWLGLVIVAAVAGTFILDWRLGLALAGIAVLLWPLQAVRIAVRVFRRGVPLGTAMPYGLLTLLSKWRNSLARCVTAAIVGAAAQPN